MNSSFQYNYFFVSLLLCNIFFVSQAQFVIQSPSSIAGNYGSLRSSFSGVIPPLSQGINGSIVVVNPCNTLNSSLVAGKIVITSVSAGGCLYWTQAQNVIAAGGLGVILWKSQPTYLVMLYTSTTKNISIPCISVDSTVASNIISNAAVTTVNISIGYTPCPTDQKAALLDLYAATTGTAWRFGATGQYNAWGTSTDPCSAWHGVACSATGVVRGLSLPLNYLVGSIPSSITALTSLSQIQLTSNTGLSGYIPDGFFQFPLMKYMEVESCSLNGSIPDSIKTMSRLVYLKLDTNSLTGTIPEALGQLVNLTTVLLNGNSFTGSIPNSIGNLTKATQVSFSKNQMAGTIPRTIGNMTSLTRLEIATNSFYGSMPSSFGNLKSLTFLDMSNNLFAGTLPTELFQLTALTYLNVAENSFAGTLPNFSGATTLVTINIANNLFTGTILGTSLPTNLGTLKAAYNSFTALSTFSSLYKLGYLDVSHNNLTSMASLRALATVTSDQVVAGTLGLVTINLSHNQMLNDTALMDTSLSNWPSLTTIDVSYNLLGGTLTAPSSPSTCANLQKIDFSNNRITGTIPEVFAQLPSLATFNLVDNQLHHGSSSLLPAFVEIDYSTLEDNSTGNFYCPSFTSSGSTSLQLSIDNSYHDFFECNCKSGYRRISTGSILECKECLDHMICNGGTSDDVWTFEAYYYPTPSVSDPQYMLDCSNCVSESSEGVVCTEGYQGRLCSECVDGYYLSNQKCMPCEPSGLLLFCVVLILIVAIILGFAFIAIKFGAVQELAQTKSIELATAIEHKTAHPVLARAFAPPPSVPSRIFGRWKFMNKFAFDPSLAIIAIVINFTQTQSILTRSLTLGYSLKKFLAALQIANISGTGFGTECVSPLLRDMVPRYLFTTLQPIVLTGFALLAVVVGVVILKLLERNYQWWLIVCAKSWLFLLDFLFFPVVLSCIAYFKCSSDPATRISYLDDFPYASCESVPSTIKYAFLLINFFGTYALFVVVLIRFKRTKSRMEKLRIRTVFGFFFDQYKPQYIWAGLIYLLRRLAFSLVNGLLSAYSIELYICNMVFICGSILVVHTVRPFKRQVDNQYEIASYVVLSFTYSIIFVNYFLDGGIISTIFYFLVNAALYANFLVVFILSKFPSWHLIRSFLLCEWAKSRVEEFEPDESDDDDE